jgi:hypothetical protein
LTESQLEDIRVALGFGMGSSRLDNELIGEAFIMGAGFACGIAIDFLELSQEQSNSFALECLAIVNKIVDDDETV